MPEMKHNQQNRTDGLWTFGLLKEAATLDIASPDTCQCLNLPFEPFTSQWIHPCYNQPWVSRPNFMLETNSTVVWLYAGGVSLILPWNSFPRLGHIFTAKVPSTQGKPLFKFKKNPFNHFWDTYEQSNFQKKFLCFSCSHTLKKNHCNSQNACFNPADTY